VVLVVLSLVACKSDSKSESKPTPAPPPQGSASAAKEAAHDIASQPRTAIAGKTLFLEFTIEVPATATGPMKGETGTSWTFKDSALELLVAETSEIPTQSKAKGSDLKPQPDEKTTHKVTDDPTGYVVVNRKDDATGFVVRYCKDLDPAKPPSGICCNVSLKSETAIVDIDKLIAFGEQMCRTVKATNR
jgi:hypothetical protein